MTAARVLNPVVLSEFCKIRATPSTMSRNLTCGRQLNRIKRDLFGPANPTETNKIFNEELEKHQDKAIKKWGFDFRNGSPLTANTNFIWERVSFEESSYAPTVYTLTRAAHVRQTTPEPTSYELLLDARAEREHFVNHTYASTDETDSCDDSQDESLPLPLPIFKVPAVIGHNSNSSTSSNVDASTLSGRLQLRKRQPKITEYMKERKRLAQAPKKATPPKRMRTNSGGSISHSAQAQSITSHFSLRVQRNNFN